MLNLFGHEMRSRIGAIIGWGLGLTAFGAMYISIFPEAGDQMAGLADLDIYVAMGIDLGSFAGFIASVVLQFLPLLLGIYAIITSTQALAGEEDNGTLELVLAMPLKRWQIVTTKALAISLIALIILIIAGLGNALVLNAVKQTVEVDVTAQQLFVAILNGWPLTIAFVMIGMFFGAYLPNRRAAVITTTFIFVASFFGNTLAGLAESLEPVQAFSLFHYLDNSTRVFSDGVMASDVLTLLGVALAFFALTLLAFQRRDVTVGALPWARARTGAE